jgi:hypothetical protein
MRLVHLSKLAAAEVVKAELEVLAETAVLAELVVEVNMIMSYILNHVMITHLKVTLLMHKLIKFPVDVNKTVVMVDSKTLLHVWFNTTYHHGCFNV